MAIFDEGVASVELAAAKDAIVRRRLIDILMDDRLKADLVLNNGRIVNVITREVYPGDVAIAGELILRVGNAADLIGEKTEVVDLQGRFVAPGFIDSHMHFESSMLTVSEFARLSIPTGTTTLVADPHEIGNALGPAGIKAITEEARQAPSNVYFVVPSLTPDSPGLETAGYDIASKDMEELLGYYHVIGIGELQGFSNARYVYANNPGVVDDLAASTAYARSIGKMVDGNAPELFGNALAAHIICGGGRVSCHETTTKKEAVEKLRQGVYLFMREGSTQRNMAECIRAVTEEGMDSRRCILATDDMVAEDLERSGHMNEVVRRTIAAGVDPVEAIQMVTINPATYFGFEHVGVLAPGKQADLAIIGDLSRMNVEQVYLKGRKAAEGGRLLLELPPYEYPIDVKMSVRRGPVSAADLAVKAGEMIDRSGNTGGHGYAGSAGYGHYGGGHGLARARVIVVIPDQNLTESLEVTLPIRDGAVCPDPASDILGIAVVERYGRSGGIGRAFVKGFGLKAGAFAESVAHDTHNIIVAGTDPEEMACAVNRVIAIGGGIAVVKGGRVLAELRLPVAGLITDELSGPELSRRVALLHRVMQEELGCTLHAPFMHLSFLALTTSPAWKITDRGLIDVNNYRILPPLVE
ncbi:MAG: adenine deaminase [Syntrophothermus sp.]